MWQVKLLSVLGLSFLNAILYRLGGEKGYNTKLRDLGVPLITTATFVVYSYPFFPLSIGMLLLHFGLLFASLTTYFKKKGEDAHWWNWLLCGIAYSLSALPITFILHNWIGFGLRTVILTGIVVAVSELSDNVWVEECSRGFIITATIPLLF